MMPAFALPIPLESPADPPAPPSRCRRCGRALKSAPSRNLGLGPVCARKGWFARHEHSGTMTLPFAPPLVIWADPALVTHLAFEKRFITLCEQTVGDGWVWVSTEHPKYVSCRRCARRSRKLLED